jgi:hypothetical protein
VGSSDPKKKKKKLRLITLYTVTETRSSSNILHARPLYIISCSASTPLISGYRTIFFDQHSTAQLIHTHARPRDIHNDGLSHDVFDLFFRVKTTIYYIIYDVFAAVDFVLIENFFIATSSSVAAVNLRNNNDTIIIYQSSL